MGMNFYTKQDHEHIGKRTAFIGYCWECKTIYDELPEKCPKCGVEKREESLTDSAVGLELGFAKEPLERKGLRTASRWSWDMPPEQFWTDKPDVVNENCKEYTFVEFVDLVLDSCPLEKEDSIGDNFC